MSIANPYLHGENDLKNTNLKKWASVGSMSVAGILIVVKMTAFFVTDSVSLLSSLMDSCFDAFASLMTMLSIMHAATPADEEHRFGHGKLEALSALAQAVFVFGSGAFLIFESVHRFIEPQRIKDPTIGISVMVMSIVLTFFLILFQMYVIRRTKSVAISADHMHYKGDLLMSLGVFAAMALSYYSKWPYFDPIFASIIALSLLYSAWSITRESVDILMDKEIPTADREKILQLVTAHPGVQAVHDLRTRSTGDRIFIEFHLEIDGNLTLKRAHDITEQVEKIIFDAFPKSEVIIHQEPAGIDDHRIDNIIPIKGS
ncbi:MAG: cation diffusion facilitator family transporter [Micavibrio sp.]|nr:cation diffusion facilitator family transporter [Micavibrio sp.]